MLKQICDGLERTRARKRLERGTFLLPNGNISGDVEIDANTLSMLVGGIDLPKVHTGKWPRPHDLVDVSLDLWQAEGVAPLVRLSVAPVWHKLMGSIMFIANGTLIDDKYEVTSSIGVGGMGVVYEAKQLGLDRLVALKILSYVPSDAKEDVVRFEREALVLSKLQQINIVQFYAYGVWQNVPYIAMERISGVSLQTKLSKNEPLLLQQVIDYTIQICNGLEHAHLHSVFHRDIKPSNIIISTSADGRDIVKLIDFGLAKLVGSSVQKLTQTNTALGSVMYMSPEQCVGKPVDARSDIYSLGCLLYHCFTGEPPYSADNAVAVMFQQTNEPVQDIARFQRLPSALQQVVARCMAKEPANRFQSCGELRDNLIQAAQSESVALGISSSMNPVTASKNPVDLYADKLKFSRVKSLVAPALAISLVFAGIVCFTQHKVPTQSNNAGAMTSANSPNEIMASLIGKNDRLIFQGVAMRLSPTELDQLAQATEQVRHNHACDPNRLIVAYAILSSAYEAMGETEKVRSLLSAAVKISDRVTNIQYINILTRYHKLCSLSGCELSLLDKLREAKQRFPGRSETSPIDLLLGQDYLKLGRDGEARHVLLSVVKNSRTSEEIDRAQILLKMLDDKTEAIKQIKLLSKHLDEQSKAKKETANTAYQLVRYYRCIDKDPADLILQQLANPKNPPFDKLVLRFELGESYLRKGDQARCEQIWTDMLEPLRHQSHLDRPLKISQTMSALPGVAYYQYHVVSGLARIYLKSGRYRECIKLTEQWSKDGASQNAPAFYAHSITVCRAHAYRRLGATAEAEKLYRQTIANLDHALKKNKKDRDLISSQIEARYGLACSLYSHGQYQESFEFANAAVYDAYMMGECELPKAALCRLVITACLEKLNRVQLAADVRRRAHVEIASISPNQLNQVQYIFDDVLPVSSLRTK